MATRADQEFGSCSRGFDSLPLNEIFNFFHSTADNVGDRMCGPAQYLWPGKVRNRPFRSSPTRRLQSVIVGGGQIYSDLESILAKIRTNNPSAAIVGWGIGLPQRGSRDSDVLKTVRQFSAFGTRNYDWRDELDFVPCASCLSPLFDLARAPAHEVVVYLHRKKPQPENIPPGIPVLSNVMQSPSKVIDFIASGDTVVTSSYHGVYWAQLLGRRVVCIPYNEKFATLQHLPVMSTPQQWTNALRTAIRSEPLLDEYREINRAFSRKAMELWNG